MSEVTIKFFGNSMVSLVSSLGTEVLIDPAEPGLWDNLSVPPKEISPTAVIVTHEHRDHNFVEADWIKGNPQIINNIANPGFNEETVDFYNPIDHLEIKDVSLSTMRTIHAPSQMFPDPEKYGSNASIILQIDGLRIVHLGDSHGTIHDGFNETQINHLNQPDILFMPCGHVQPNNFIRAARVISPKIIVPLHWYSSEDLEEFLQEVSKHETPIQYHRKGSLETVSRSTLPESQELWVMDLPSK